MSWPPRKMAFDRAYAGRFINKATGRMANHYTCAGCGELFPQKECRADHADPVVGPEGFDGWDTYITRMFCPVSNFQILCNPCHTKKSNLENEERRQERQK